MLDEMRLTRGTFVVLASSLLVGVSMHAQETEEDSEEDLIRRTVQETQLAGHQDHQLVQYMTLWAPDAKVTLGRRKEPGPHDLMLSRAQLEAVRRFRFRGAPQQWLEIKFENTIVDVRGETATLTQRVTFRMDEYLETIEEVYRLRKTDTRWEAYENRWWPVQIGEPDSPLQYTVELWDAFDNYVEVARRIGTASDQYRALMNAFRFAEAWKTASEWTVQSPASASAWAARGTAAVLSGEAADAEESFRKALVLDPEIAVPDYARQADVWEGDEKKQSPAETAP